MNTDKRTALVTCSHCGNQSEIECPQNMCLAECPCEACGKNIEVSSEAGDCCVMCEHSDKQCSAPAQVSSSDAE